MCVSQLKHYTSAWYPCIWRKRLWGLNIFQSGVFFCFFSVTTENCKSRAVTAGVFAKSPAALLKLLQSLSGVCETGTSSLSWSQEVMLALFMVKCCLMFTDMGESFIENKSGFLLPAWRICQFIKWQQIEKQVLFLHDIIW